MKILVINSGSSSLKLQLIESKNWQTLFKGQIDEIGLDLCKFRGEERIKTHHQAFKLGISQLLKSGAVSNLKEIKAVGHRVVHGGEKYWQATLITPKIIKEIQKLSHLAPLHNPANLAGILASRKLLPSIPDVAVFDTAFHHTLPEKAYLYALPFSFYQKYGIRRYGFHGTSHQYVSEQAIFWLKKNKLPWRKMITVHLGNGCSLTAVKNGQSVETSMGFTPLEGVPMGTRPGNFDPSILFYLAEEKKMGWKKISQILNYQSGLLGLSEISNDVRKLWAAYQKKDPRAKRTFGIFADRIAQYIGAYTIILGGLDALVFTAGIGENAWYLRKFICNYFSPFGLTIVSQKNQKAVYPKETLEISAPKSRIKVLVIPTNEERKIAEETSKLIKS